MSIPTIAAHLACVFVLFSDPILAAPIELGRTLSSTESPASGKSGGSSPVSLTTSEAGAATLDGAAVVRMASSDGCAQVSSCAVEPLETLIERLISSSPGLAGPISWIDGELLELFRGEVIRQSSVETLFSRN